MTWTAVTSISLKSDWQYTEPVTGAFFRLKHTGFPRDGRFQIAQAEFNADNSVNLSEPVTFDAGSEFEVLSLIASPSLSNRRLAIRKLIPEPSFKNQLREVLTPSILQTVEENFFLPRRSAWTVAIEVSDVVMPQGVDYSQQFDSLNSQIASLSNQLVIVSNGVSEINSKLSNSSEPTPLTNTKELTYASNGDTNGLFYWIGTNYGQGAWANPFTSGQIAIVPSSSTISPSLLVNRAGGQSWYTSNAANSFVVFDTGNKRSLLIKTLLLRHDNESAYFLRNFKLQGSNDVASNDLAGINAATWADLLAKTNDTTINAPEAWGNFPIAGITQDYRWFKLLQPDINSSSDNYLVLGEAELYGTLITTT